MGLSDLKNGMSIDASEGDTMLGQDLSPDAYIGPGNDGMQLSSLLSFTLSRDRENLNFPAPFKEAIVV